MLVTPSSQASRDALLDALCAPGDDLLVPAPAYHDLAAAAEARSLEVRRYTLRYDGAWHIERSSLRAAITPRTRVVVVASPADPTGAVLSHEELAFVEEICSTRGLVLIGDEVLADTACQPASSVIAVTRCPAFQMSGLLGLPSVPRVELTWIAAGGPERLVRPLFTRIEARAGAIAGATEPGAYAGFHAESVSLAALRARLRDNRARLASAAMREAPWTVLNSGGGCSAVLEVGLAEDEVALCISLLEEGVVLWPGKYAGFESDGFLVVSLLPDPLEFERGLEILERRLRGPLF